jgi:hypothetical protein
MTTMLRVHGSTDDLEIAYTQRLLPFYPLSVDRNRHRIEIDEEETTTLDTTGRGDMGTDVTSSLQAPVPADTQSTALD